MRKRNIALTCAAGILFALLLLLLLFTFAFLWGRVFAPSTPTSQFTLVWQWIRNIQSAKNFMAWLRQTPFYAACCNAAYDAAGTLEPLKCVMGLMGSVSFLLGAINEIKSTRSFGMIMRDVIDYAFPFHLYIQAPLYALFSITGYYACTKNIGIAAAISLFGLTLCFTYSLCMAVCLFIYPKLRENLVLFYINGVTTGRYRKRKNKNDHKKTTGVCVLDYARYIGQQWTKGNILQIQRNNKWKEEELLINLSVFWLTSEKKWLKETLSPKGKKAELQVPKDFHSIFTDAQAYDNESAKYVLYTKALPFMGNKTVAELEINARRCCQIWEQLFSPIEKEKRKAQLAYAILWHARSSNSQIFTMMALGLLIHLGIPRCDDANSDEAPDQEKKVRFLYDIHSSASETIPEENLSNVQDFNDNWAEIVLLAASSLQWIQDIESNTKSVNNLLIYNLMQSFSKYVSGTGLGKIEQHFEKYIVLSYLLFTFENNETRGDMTAYVTQHLFPNVCMQLCRYISR